MKRLTVARSLLIAMAVVLVLTLPWMMDTMISFTVNLFNSIPTLGR